ncbi:MAG: hypothetical protein EHM20_17185 [Alphaproteobacteria bacterium]|nr:MAG: hypothetical protein EHM20_17185 [Alphaproteobacteria bacterium]
MKSKIYAFIVSVFIIGSCTFQQREISMVGKWHRFSHENGYCEYEIDSQYVVAFSERMGKSKLEYKIENDSFKYTTIDYSAKIIPVGDSIINLEAGNNTATLIRFNESVDAFLSAPDENDSLNFSIYMEYFKKRAEQAWTEAGFKE